MSLHATPVCRAIEVLADVSLKSTCFPCLTECVTWCGRWECAGELSDLSRDVTWLGECAVIPKSTSPDHLRSNLDVVDWELPPGDFDALCRLPYQARMAGNGRAELSWGVCRECIDVQQNSVLSGLSPGHESVGCECQRLHLPNLPGRAWRKMALCTAV